MYKLELQKVIEQIKKRNAKHVLVQVPDGLKPRSQEICDFIEEMTDAKAYVWLGGCFGACDLPMGTEELGVDLIVAFGHNLFRKEYW